MATRALEADVRGLTAADAAERLADGRSDAVPARSSRSLGAGTEAAAEAERPDAEGMRALILASRDHPLDNPDMEAGAAVDANVPRAPAGDIPVALITTPRSSGYGPTPRSHSHSHSRTSSVAVTLNVISGDNAVPVGAVAAGLGLPGAQHLVHARSLLDSDAPFVAVALELLWRLKHGHDSMGKTGDSRAIRG